MTTAVSTALRVRAQRPTLPRRRRRRALERILMELPYPLAVRVVRRVLVPCARHLFEESQWLAVPGTDRGAARLPPASVVRRRLLTTLLGAPRLAALSRSRWPGDATDWFAVRGLEHLEAARAGGRKVVVVNSHYGAVQCVPLLLARLGFRFHSVECRDPFPPLRLARPHGLTVIPTAGAFLAQTALRAKRALDADGMLCLAADGYAGASGVTLAFHGRARPFAAGFAELATAADAAVIPAIAPIDDTGRATLALGAAFADGDRSRPRAERVHVLIRQYAAWLAQRWAEDPGNVFNMDQFAALPLWPPAGDGSGRGWLSCSSRGAQRSTH